MPPPGGGSGGGFNLVTQILQDFTPKLVMAPQERPWHSRAGGLPSVPSLQGHTGGR